MNTDQDALREEFARFASKNSHVEQVEVLLIDSNGIPRGKWLPFHALNSIARSGVRLPVSVLGETPSFSSVSGPGTGGLLAGDPDGLCFPVPGTLARVPWRQRPAAQLLVGMREMDGRSPHPFDSRHLLSRAQAELARQDLNPVVAFELEFSLYRQVDAPGDPLQAMGRSGRNRLYEMDALDDLAPFLHGVRDAAACQGIPLSGTTSEMAPGQVEINLAHVEDACRAADHAALLRRLVKQVARIHGMDATFMAKPDGARPGNGCHLHLSPIDGTGGNRFDEKEAGSDAAGPCLRHAIAGLLDTATDAQLILAPNANSLRRFRPGQFAPVRVSWGYDHRLVAVRVPSASGPNARLEHRIAGADTQHYLVLAAILGGILHGLERAQEPPPALPLDAHSADGVPLSDRWGETIERFERSEFAARIFGRAFQRMYASMKRLERSELAKDVPDTELRAYFHRA